MGSNCTRGLAENLRDELWSYFALSGLLAFNIGVVLVVYALKKATTHPVVVEVVGILLIVFGIMATLTSWYVHRQHRRRKPLCFPCAHYCCRKPQPRHSQDPDTPPSPIDLPSELPSMGTRYLQIDSNQNDKATQENRMRMFSTLEFQMYEEYTKRDNSGVERYEARRDKRKLKEESQRKKKQVHPKKPQDMAQANVYVNAILLPKGLKHWRPEESHPGCQSSRTNSRSPYELPQI